MKRFKNWLSSKSDTFSAMAGETITHREVLLVNGIFFCGCIAAITAASSLTVTLVMLATAIYLAYLFNS